MDLNSEVVYWVALAHLKNIRKKVIYNLVDQLDKKQITFKDFFNLNDEINDLFQDYFKLNKDLLPALTDLKNNLTQYTFLVEALYNQGIEVIPITSEDYPNNLKINLANDAPIIIYVKGNKKLLLEKSAAIVGSRNASEESLIFTQELSKKFTGEYKVIITGFAKGVDRKALDTSLENNGQAIIILPMGMLTVNNTLKNYYEFISNGDLLVISTFFPKSPWSVAQAMERNNYIYALADEIFIAESDFKGGTWSGALAGLRNNRKIFVRIPDSNENNANKILIDKGALGVRLKKVEEEPKEIIMVKEKESFISGQEKLF